MLPFPRVQKLDSSCGLRCNTDFSRIQRQHNKSHPFRPRHFCSAYGTAEEAGLMLLLVVVSEDFILAPAVLVFAIEVLVLAGCWTTLLVLINRSDSERLLVVVSPATFAAACGVGVAVASSRVDSRSSLKETRLEAVAQPFVDFATGDEEDPGEDAALVEASTTVFTAPAFFVGPPAGEDELLFGGLLALGGSRSPACSALLWSCWAVVGVPHAVLLLLLLPGGLAFGLNLLRSSVPEVSLLSLLATPIRPDCGVKGCCCSS
ncbi:unnamed protein product [Amoebophrya sp. A120]|nr:unnamed protein product [Amoebophrya sp. A120]|eukprot:GSA120T00020528001.1